jgi:hypothetical protein
MSRTRGSLAETASQLLIRHSQGDYPIVFIDFEPCACYHLRFLVPQQLCIYRI